MRQFRLSCCGAIMSKVPYECYSCGKTSFFAEELDKEEQVIQMGSFSGDKKKEVRPWGSFEVLIDERGYKVKKIVVNKEGKLSLQLHTKRNEYWHILEGHGEIQVGNSVWIVESGESIEIDKFEVHRISNVSETPLVILELQRGVCEEDDIIRIKDDYGRV